MCTFSSPFRLSGVYPFTDIAGIKCVEYCDLNFDNPVFRNVSDECIDFIERLLVQDDK